MDNSSRHGRKRDEAITRRNPVELVLQPER